MPVMPRRQSPALDLPLAGGGRIDLSTHKAERFTLLMFYRGFFCQRCKGNLGELNRDMDRLKAVGTDVVAISMDTQEKAEWSKQDWGLDRIAVAYGMSADTARDWDLFLSNHMRGDETPLFSEPAVILRRADGTIQFAVINSMQRMRPYAKDIIETIEHLAKTGELGRGEVV